MMGEQAVPGRPLGGSRSFWGDPRMVPAVGKPLLSVLNRAAGCSRLKGRSLTKPELF